jgi:hypothetical protein
VAGNELRGAATAGRPEAWDVEDAAPPGAEAVNATNATAATTLQIEPRCTFGA